MIAEGDVWYGICSYWTDDLTKLGRSVSGLPGCPNGHVGFEIDAPSWWADAERYENDGHPRYVEFLKRKKEFCSPQAFIKLYDDWVRVGFPPHVPPRYA
jgi:hypothetical protein